jgi:hypothetical protein
MFVFDGTKYAKKFRSLENNVKIVHTVIHSWKRFANLVMYNYGRWAHVTYNLNLHPYCIDYHPASTVNFNEISKSFLTVLVSSVTG